MKLTFKTDFEDNQSIIESGEIIEPIFTFSLRDEDDNVMASFSMNQYNITSDVWINMCDAINKSSEFIIECEKDSGITQISTHDGYVSFLIQIYDGNNNSHSFFKIKNEICKNAFMQAYQYLLNLEKN